MKFVSLLVDDRSETASAVGLVGRSICVGDTPRIVNAGTSGTVTSNVTCGVETWPDTGAGFTTTRRMTPSVSTFARLLTRTSSDFVIMVNLDASGVERHRHVDNCSGGPCWKGSRGRHGALEP